MAKQAALGVTTFSVDDSGNVQRDIRNDITEFDLATPRAEQKVTGIDKSAEERLLVMADLTVTMKGVWNPAATTSSHAVFRTIPSTSVNRLITIVIASQTLAPTVILTDYKLSRKANGEFTWDVPGALSTGVVPVWS